MVSKLDGHIRPERQKNLQKTLKRKRDAEDPVALEQRVAEFVRASSIQLQDP
jgi:hypothetical protein